MIEALAWVATAAILGTYLLISLARTPSRHLRKFHWANALGAIPLLAVNVQAQVWPQVVVTVGFGVPAWVTLVRSND